MMNSRWTLRKRLLLWSTTCIVLTCLSLFFSVQHYIEISMIKKVDQNLSQISQELKSLYERGYHLSAEGYSQNFNPVPAKVISIAKESMSDIELLYWKKVLKEKQEIYEFKGVSKGLLYEVEVSAGEVIELEEEVASDKVTLLKEEYNLRFEELRQYWILIGSVEVFRGGAVDAKFKGLPEYHDKITTFVTNQGEELRLLDIKLSRGDYLRVGCHLLEEEEFMKKYRKAFLVVLAPILLFTFFVSYFLSKGITKEVEFIEKGIKKINQGHLVAPITQKLSINEFHQLAKNFNQMANQIHENMVELKAITDQVAHDLRTPITRIRSNIEMNTDASGRDAKIYEEILTDCEELENTIGLMLEISEVEASTRPLNKKKVELYSVVEKALELFGPLFESKGIEVSLGTNKKEYMAEVDKKMIQRVISNLMDNALKYTEQGYVRMSLTLNDEFVIFKIEDTGVGIEENEIPKIFKRFYRPKASVGYAGNGLGLSYVDAVIRAHLGRIEVSSELNKGSQFEVFIPLKAKMSK